MDPVNLLSVCVIAFVSVFALLSFLALAMRAITALFPERIAKVDPVIAAAISSTIATIIPGAQVTRIEEES